MFTDKTVKLLGIICLLLFLFVYFFLNRRIKEARLIHTRLDNYIPFIPFFVIPYLFLYIPLLYGTIVVSYVQTMKQFYEFFFSSLIVLSESFAVFVLFPTRVKEFEITGSSVFEKIIKTVYAHDMRVTAFPSIHVGVSLVTSYYLTEWYPSAALASIVVAISIIISTVTIKQHSVVDIVGGIITGTSSIILGKLVLFMVGAYVLM